MSFITWKEEETTFVSEIDEQHREIVKKINDLHLLLPSENKEEKISSFIELMTILVNHFKTEESLMKEHKFGNVFSHTQEHNKMIDKMVRFKNDLKSDKADLNLEFLMNVKNWFHNHNKINDIKMGKFLAEKGVQ